MSPKTRTVRVELQVDTVSPHLGLQALGDLRGQPILAIEREA